MAFGENFLKSFFGNDYLKDFSHASKTFRTNDYELAPRQKFLYYVKFNLNTIEIPKLQNLFTGRDQNDIGLLVKSVDLPQFRVDSDFMNQYNRKRLVQTRVNYDPINIVMHDDNSDLSRTLWYNYFAYHYKDSSYDYRNDAPSINGASGQLGNLSASKGYYTNRNTYSEWSNINDWGFVGESYTDGQSANNSTGKPRFFRDITIYGFNQHKFSAYVLINPIITALRHDTYDYSQDTGIMENTMQVAYETVKYYSGDLSGTYPDANAQGFADSNRYDTVKSPISIRGANTLLGPNGLIDQAAGVITDLTSQPPNIIGAVQKIGGTYETWKDADLGNVLEQEGKTILQDVLRNPSSTKDFFFPNNTPAAQQKNNTVKSTTQETTTPPTGNP